MTDRTDLGRLRIAARDELGISRLTSEQEDALRAALTGRDVLAVLPTGAGKSAIYQLAGFARPGPTLVVSPLLALQFDQVDRLGGALGGAVALNSELTDRQRAEHLDALSAGEIEFCFCAPEQLERDELVELLAQTGPSLMVVDEAHCVATWGHDFRPAYLGLGSVAVRLGRPPVLAATATASPPVRDEIVRVLGLRDAFVVDADLERSNIDLRVDVSPDADTCRRALVADTLGIGGRRLCYVGRRRDAEDLAQTLEQAGQPALAYHAGLSARAREQVQRRFVTEDDLVVCATIAFGMGIDVADVRAVLHLEAPESLDAYYQELGRAGRDGLPAVAVLHVVASASGSRRFAAGSPTTDGEDLRSVVDVLSSTTSACSTAELERRASRSRRRIHRVLDRLHRVGAVRRDRRGRFMWSGTSEIDHVVEEIRRLDEREALVAATRTTMIERYLSGAACRWRTLVTYLGQPGRDCGHCDVCDRSEPVDEAARGPWEQGSTVDHPAWGVGTVVDLEPHTVIVRFDDGGYRTLDREIVDEYDLLHPVDGPS